MLFQNRFSSFLLLCTLWASLFHTTVLASEVDVERESSATFSQYNGNGTYSPQDSEQGERFFEKTVVFNYFVNGHENKITAEVSRVSLDQFDTEVGDETVYSLQWDLSF
ncbi:MAG: hypothetical protein SVW51_18130 [Pseudomonadota bacterium]|nr:hypothetical protein [Pseudomonadota bacterium]